MNYSIKSFETLTKEELYEILALRNEVFILEQNCPYQDVDGKDVHSWHVLGYKDNQLVTYCRIVGTRVSYPEISIGRVIVKETYRHLHYGHQLLNQAIDYIQNELKENKIRISAQAHLIQFYQAHGFETVGDIYLEDDIEHIEMYFERV